MRVNRQKAKVEDFEEPLEMKVSSGNIFADLGFENAANERAVNPDEKPVQRIFMLRDNVAAHEDDHECWHQSH